MYVLIWKHPGKRVRQRQFTTLKKAVDVAKGYERRGSKALVMESTDKSTVQVYPRRGPQKNPPNRIAVFTFFNSDGTPRRLVDPFEFAYDAVAHAEKSAHWLRDQKIPHRVFVTVADIKTGAFQVIWDSVAQTNPPRANRRSEDRFSPAIGTYTILTRSMRTGVMKRVRGPIIASPTVAMTRARAMMKPGVHVLVVHNKAAHESEVIWDSMKAPSHNPKSKLRFTVHLISTGGKVRDFAGLQRLKAIRLAKDFLKTPGIRDLAYVQVMTEDGDRVILNQEYHGNDPKDNPKGRIRMGKLIEIRYDRDHGANPGYYKHKFDSHVPVYYSERDNKIIAG
jgi:hypothetical protein